jgi:hypothetical protein
MVLLSIRSEYCEAIMSEWNNASVQKGKSVYDVLAALREAGASIEVSASQPVGQLLDQGEAVLNDEALWRALPDRIGRYTKPKLRRWLRTELDACR